MERLPTMVTDFFGGGMEFHVLGHLQVTHDGAILPIGSAHKPRLLLAALLSSAERTMTTELLIGAVWGSKPPASARRNLQLYIHQLRSAIGRDFISSGPGGYRIHAGDALDASRFGRLAVDGTSALEKGDPLRAADALREALDLWRGPAYSEFTESSLVHDEAARLEELRLSVYERWAEAQLALGNYGVTIEALSGLTRSHPYREDLRASLMRALYGAGRQADALKLYRSTRSLLAEELGIEPGPQLQRLHEQMLRGDVDKFGGKESGVAAVDIKPQILLPRQLPASVSGFAGREDELKVLDKMLADAASQHAGSVAISAITGMAGVGKTTLALHWAHMVASEFPHGQLYIDLKGFATEKPMRPIEALTTLLGALGVSPQHVPVDVAAAAAQFRSLLAGRRMLILLDNARSSAQVQPLLPANTGCFVLITSRDRLGGLAVQGARRLVLDVFRLEESVDLLRRLLGNGRVSAEVTAATSLARICAHLPLALRIAGAALSDQPRRPIANYVANLELRQPLAALAVDGDDDIAVRNTFDLSYRTLPESAQRMFRRLGLVPLRDFTSSAVAALADTSESEAHRTLEKLSASHLLTQQGGDGRFTMHDLLRQFAAELAEREDTAAQRDAAVQRLHAWFLSETVAAVESVYPHVLRLPPSAGGAASTVGVRDVESALRWLDAERRNLVAATVHAARSGPRAAAWRYADALRGYFDQRRHRNDWLTVARAAAAAARADGDALARASAYHGLAQVHFCLGSYRQSVIYLQRTLLLAAEAGWDRLEAAASSNLAIALVLQGHTRESIEYVDRALKVHERIDWPSGRARVTETLASAYRDMGRLDEGCRLAVHARALWRASGARLGEAHAVASLGELYALLGRLGDASRLLRSALSTFCALGSRHSEAMCHAWLARVDRDMGRLKDAAHSAQRALKLADGVGDPRLQAVARHAVALVHYAEGDYTEAMRLHQTALAIADSRNLRYTAGEILLGLATAHGSCGDHQAAIDLACRAMELARQAGFNVIEGCALTILARAYHSLGNSALALERAALALNNHQRTGHRIGEAETRELLESILRNLGNEPAAMHHGDIARALRGRIVRGGNPAIAECRAS
ncbi:AfsR/SARP family transcriptional regulator [Micromonospora echinaurantiaca]|nr:BTAD domain-containing putative transcriptional regulator [Micromonospora echinaurantiaca]